jgi:hypothetical protein
MTIEFEHVREARSSLNYGDNSLSVIDARSGVVLRTVPVGSSAVTWS